MNQEKKKTGIANKIKKEVETGLLKVALLVRKLTHLVNRKRNEEIMLFTVYLKDTWTMNVSCPNAAINKIFACE